ncbi:pro-MCH isoform X1 [Poecilia latipinna]|nr:PREDICTED: pro-MCH isoform X1 [Poecilia formosa]XP_014855263.1 PREDICTED: pro-MCH isoform X1 [Poecilia mexicana]XP_014909548.1 PREDICTED: pro-MCH isoform X1 [Poecilia latipinna]
MSVYSLLFALMLFSEMNSNLVTVAIPSTTVEDGAAEQEGLDTFLSDDDVTEHAAVPLMYRRSLTNDGTSKIIVIPDMNLEGQRIRGLNRRYPLVAERSLDRTPDEFTLKINKREKDLDMLRCMIGRVYRPCWEA